MKCIRKKLYFIPEQRSVCNNINISSKPQEFIRLRLHLRPVACIVHDEVRKTKYHTQTLQRRRFILLIK